MKSQTSKSAGRVWRTRATLAAVAASAATAGLAGLSTGTAAAKSSSHYPVTIKNCGTSITFAKEPSRAVTNDLPTLEDMVALGLEKRMVGEFGAHNALPSGWNWPAGYAAGIEQVKEISPSYATLEPLVGTSPDFFFAGWNYGLHVGTTMTPANLAQYNIKTLALTESCAHVQASRQQVWISDTYQDLSNLGQIFNVQAKANQIIASMKSQIATVQTKVAKLPKVTVFDYDSGTSAPFTGPGLAMPTAEIAKAGGVNIFASLKQTWTTVSWEQVVAKNPRCIIINNYSTPSAAAKIKFLETSPVTKNIAAVKHRCFLSLTYDEVTPSPRNAEAVVKLAHWLHPQAFGLAADGS